MPHPLLHDKQKEQSRSETLLSATEHQQSRRQTTQMTQMEMARILRRPRSSQYMQAMHQLDAGGRVCNRQQVDQIMDCITKEFPDIDITPVLVGIVSECYLGDPYEVHTLTPAGSIITHYRRGEPLPDGMERARSLARRGGYDFIEVYADCLRAVSGDGSVSVIPG